MHIDSSAVLARRPRGDPLAVRSSAAWPRSYNPFRSSRAWLCPPRHSVSKSTIRGITAHRDSWPAYRLAIKLPSFVKFQPYTARGHLRDERSAITVQKPGPQKEMADPAPRRGQPQGGAPIAPALIEHLLGNGRGVLVELGLVFRKGADRIVQEVAAQAANLALKAQSGMNHAGEAGFVAAVDAALPVGIPARVTDPRAQIPSQPRHLVNIESRRAVLPSAHGILQLFAQFFVGIKEENPVVGEASEAA